MKHYFLKNIFTSAERIMIDCCVRGMYSANISEMHSAQSDGAYGGFTEALERLITTKYNDSAWSSLYHRYNFDCADGEDFLKWFDEIVKQDTSEIADLLTHATVQLEIP
jgi:hypothetical protein